MITFTAIVLVCNIATTPVSSCDENTAIDVVSTHVQSEMSCKLGWEEMIARGALKNDGSANLYVRTLCRRNKV